MDTVIVIAEALVVLGAIVLGVRQGGIGLGLWGVVGTAILVFGFRMDPGSAPVDAFFIIIAVITASAAMQAAGGIDYLVGIASRIIQRNPRRLTYVAPLVAFLFTMAAGTSNIFFALIPVIYETAYRNGQRPERALAAATVTSGLGITASPVSAAMAAYLTLMPGGFTLATILAITVPAGIVACLATSFVQQRLGRELLDDQKYLARVRAGDVELPETLRASAQERGIVAGTAHDESTGPAAALPPHARRSAVIFLIGVLIIVVLGFFPQLRPEISGTDGTEPLGMTTVIELVMFSAALVILVACRVKAPTVMDQPLLKSGLVAAIALFGIAWMADTFIEGNQQTIVDPLADLVRSQPLLIAVALFLVCGLTTSQSTATRTIVPIALGAGMMPAIVTALWPSLIGVWLFPANGSQIAAVATDHSGTTRLSPVPVWHSFTIPMLVSWVAACGTGLLIAQLF